MIKKNAFVISSNLHSLGSKLCIKPYIILVWNAVQEKVPLHGKHSNQDKLCNVFHRAQFRDSFLLYSHIQALVQFVCHHSVSHQLFADGTKHYMLPMKLLALSKVLRLVSNAKPWMMSNKLKMNDFTHACYSWVDKCSPESINIVQFH